MIDQHVGNYRVVRKLGEGGMGIVYEGVHEQIGRRVAIKVLHPELTRQADTVSRFLTEARLVSMLQHPGVVYTFEFGQLPDHTAYIIMEYLEGESLGKRLKSHGGRLGASAGNLARQIASALAAAHARGIVHRDLKPDNVMIVRDAEAIGGERAKILDFGIAKIQESADAADAAAVKTRPGALVGTPRYMSPEQCRGGGEITGKSDVYSLGVMLYEMVSGRPPMVAEAMGELIVMHIMMEPPPLRELDPTLPLELTQLVHAMLRKNPDERPAMTEVVKQLEQQGAGHSIPPLGAVGPPSPSLPDVVGMLATPTTLREAAGQSPQTTKLASRRFVAVGAAALVLVLVALASGPLLRRPPPGNGTGTIAAAKPVEQPTSPVSAAPRKVHWRVSSQPPGAKVLRSSDGMQLGTTPWQTELDAAAGQSQLVLQLPGFIEQRLALSQSADVDRNEQLQPVPAPADAKKRNKRKVPATGSRSGKTSSEDLSDDELRIVK